MVKNFGGNKAKGVARKSTTQHLSGGHIRTAQEEGELYARATRLVGGNIVQAVGLDGTVIQAHIRKKFRGSRKRTNFISVDTWMLVGKREWGNSASDVCVCDVLEVYSEGDKARLIKTDLTVDWGKFQTQNSKQTDDDVEFLDDSVLEYQQLQEMLALQQPPAIGMDEDEDEEIYIGDI